MSTTTSNAKQEYTYSLKSVTYSEPASILGILCASEMWFQVYPPDLYIQLKRLRFHIVIVFDSGVSSANRTINQIGITDSAATGLSGATYKNLITINATANSSRRLDLSIDLTSLLKNATNNNYYVYMKFPQSYTSDGTNGGKVLLCKADALFTTTGIR